MNRHSFSIIIPVYNAAGTLETTVNSILHQSYNEYEIILINDGSTDNSEDICKKFQTENLNIKYISKKNEGAGLARAAGLKLIENEYIIFLDADDLLEDDYLLNLNNRITSDTDIIFCDYYSEIENLKNSKRRENLNLEKECYLSQSIIESVIPLILGKSPRIDEQLRMTRALWNYVFSSDFIAKNNLSFCSERDIFSEDLVFLLNSFLVATKVCYFDIAGYIHIYQKNSLSNNLSYINWSAIFGLYDYECKLINQSGIVDNDLRIKYMLFINILGSVKRICRYKTYNSRVKKRLDELQQTPFFDITFKDLYGYLQSKEKLFLVLLRKKLYFIVFLILNIMQR